MQWKWLIDLLGPFIKLIQWFQQHTTRYGPKIPKETVKIIPCFDLCWWSLGNVEKNPAMQVHGIFYVTNITSEETSIKIFFINKKGVINSNIRTQHPNEDIFGFYPILSKHETEAVVSFWIQPPICIEGESLIVDIDFIDRFKNYHKVKKVIFKSRKKETNKASFPQLELISDISNSLEKEIASVLQAEIARYEKCGRFQGGLGSIHTIHGNNKFVGVPGDSWNPNSPDLQCVVNRPEEWRIESDNALTLMKMYNLLTPEQRELFIKYMLNRLSNKIAYVKVAYFNFFVLFRIGKMKEAFDIVKVELQEDLEYGLSNLLMILNGLLKCEHHNFSKKMLDDIEQFLKDVKTKDFVDRIKEKINTIRTLQILKDAEIRERNKKEQRSIVKEIKNPDCK